MFSQIKHHSHITYPCLVPNEKGFILANYLKVKEVAVFVSATDAFSQKNTHQTVQASLVQARRVCDLARLESVRVRAYVSCVFECPYSGKVDPQKVALIAKEMVEMGCYEVSLGDTIGKGTPGQMRSLIEALKGNVSVDRIAVHCHDTYGMALANVLSALDKGVRVVDASVAGLGGCPYAEGERYQDVLNHHS